MGAADVVPGVSGGTIAFITGIYEEFIYSVKSVNLEAFRILRKEGIKAAWKYVNGNFLLVLAAGIFTSVFTLAGFITKALDDYPMYVWGFFLGLILASIWFVRKDVKQWNLRNIISMVIGAVIAYWITTISPLHGPENLWYVFLTGVLGICAMILPGISGSFIMLLMGSYYYVYDAVARLDFVVYGVFLIGCVVGITSFSRVLAWLFKHYKDVAIAMLTGFMIGSLNKVWPWQNPTQWRVNSKGEEIAWMYESVLPHNYYQDPDIFNVCLLAVFGFALLYGIEKVASKMGK